MSMTNDDSNDPHRGQPILYAGQSLAYARAAMIMLHGRGATANDILTLTSELPQTEFAFVAPQAQDNAWYPNRFMEPLATNEPWLSSAFAFIENVLDEIARAKIPPERTILLGFSQGACLTLEFVARHARRYGGVVGLSGGLIGPDGTPREYAGSLAGTPIFLGCSEADFHIPKERVLDTEKILRRLDGDVTARLYPNLGHETNADELAFVRGMMTI